MTLILLILLAVGILCTVLVVWCYETWSDNAITPFLIFSFHELVFVWPAALEAEYSGRSFGGFIAVVVLSAFCLFLIGYLLVPIRKAITVDFIRKSISVNYSEKVCWLSSIALGMIAILVGVWFYQGFPPLLQGLVGFATGDISAAGLLQLTRNARFSLTKANWFGGAYRFQGVIRIFMRYFWPYFVIKSISYQKKFNRRRWKYLSITSIIIGIVLIAGEGTRAPIMWAAFAILISISLTRSFKLREAFRFILIMTSLLLAITIFSNKGAQIFQGSETLSNLTASIAERIFFGNGRHNVAAIQFSKMGILPFEYGALHLEKLLASLPGNTSTDPFAHRLWLLLHPGASGTTFATATYISTLFLDFGVAGVWIGYLVMGIFIHIASNKLFQSRVKSPMRIGAISISILLLGKLSIYGPIGFLADAFVLGAIIGLDSISSHTVNVITNEL